jgi:hypothetical protein
MPYTLRYNLKSKLWEIVEKSTGKVVGRSKAKRKAVAIMHRQKGE